ncbi:hypothetical protein [Thalassospira sp.]|uniref:hypothetical protein n=1 Tax=Thalassospira sp. TaxID=1912094 RepID=UPI0025EA8712|nr:hypothetical protein [Thalassospira sp.]|tara:strand:- start:12204 stop:12674 length:471 start_codon:yes stop_codon:yes gene_type:complete
MSTSHRSLLSRLHRLAGAAALVFIASFWLATIIVELRGNISEIVLVKTAIAWGLFGLVPALITTGGSGFALSGGKPTGILQTKLRRMKLIAANGILILVPAAISLAVFAQHGRFDGLFAAIQGIELLAGAVNIGLIGLNIRDGLRLRKPVPKPMSA